MEKLLQYAKRRLPQMKRTLEELVQIPAPSFCEQKRVEYCLNWLKEQGVTGAYRDECDNVIVSWPPAQKGKKQSYTCLFAAHLDTVFSADTQLKVKKEQDRWSCPGIGDDTANAVVLMELIRFLFREKHAIKSSLLFVLDTGEEGLGNLRGIRAVMNEFSGQIENVVAFDLYQDRIYNGCVGSVRYRIEVKTEGGHSWMDFGNGNAIERMSAIIGDLYRYHPKGEKKTAYNAGVISGGASVNTIPQSGSFLFEYRSESAKELKRGMDYLQRTLRTYRSEKTDISCTVIGERPCMEGVDSDRQNRLAAGCGRIMELATGTKAKTASASTDCNIPLSMGIPSVCVGMIIGGKAHTHEEWICPDSMAEGLAAAIGTAGMFTAAYGEKEEKRL